MSKHKQQTNKSKKEAQSKREYLKKKTTKNSKKILFKDLLIRKLQMFLVRRPHRSFRRTRRRDYVRSLKLPGYIVFTKLVLSHLWMYRRTFGCLVVVYAIATGLLVGIASQTDFTEMASLLKESGSEIVEGGFGEIGAASLLLISGMSGSFSNFNETQQIFSALLFLMAWLATVWLVRAHMAGSRPRLRDALYNSGAPIVATVVVAFFLVLQSVPAMIGIILYGAALASGVFSTGVLAMVIGIGAFLLIVLSLYLLTSGFFALVVVTLPGMYPWQAIRTAGDLVVGRRLRILLRLAWVVFLVVLFWVVIMLPVILLSTWLQSSVQQIAWIPIVPVTLTLVSSLSVVFLSTYVYMLYRKVVDDDAAPA